MKTKKGKSKTVKKSQAAKKNQRGFKVISIDKPEDLKNTDIKPKNILKTIKSTNSVDRNVAYVRLIVVDSAKAYVCKTLISISVVLANVMYGAVLMIILIYSSQLNDLHAIICTLGFQFFMGQAILAHNPANGWSNPLKIEHRVYAHGFLNLFGLVIGGFGIYCVLNKAGRNLITMPKTVHGISGLMVVVPALFALVCGSWKRKPTVLKMHRVIGTISFLFSTICVVSGMLDDKFKNSNSTFTPLVLTFQLLYSVIVLLNVILKLILCNR